MNHQARTSNVKTEAEATAGSARYASIFLTWNQLRITALLEILFHMSSFVFFWVLFFVLFFFLTFSSHPQRARLYSRLSKSYLYRGHSHRNSVLKGVLKVGLGRQP